MDKPTKPTNLMPRSFGGVKNNWTSGMQASGYEDGVPAIYGGDNLNYQLDTTGKEFDYCEKIVDFIRDIPIGKTVTVDNNNKLVYANLISDVSNKANITLDNLNAEGKARIAVKEYLIAETYTLNDVVMDVIDGKPKFYQSLTANNTGNALSDTTYWKEILYLDDFANRDLSNLSAYGEAKISNFFKYVVNDGNVDANGNLDLIDAQVSTDTTYEYSQAGTYTFTVPSTATYPIVIMGGGGRGAISASQVANTYNKASGGSGAGFVGNIELAAGTYKIVVGAETGRTRAATVLYNSNEEALITANSGSSATASTYGATAGMGGTLTIVSGVTVGTNSADNNGNGYNGSKALNSTYSALAGGASIYNGYGAGGNSSWGVGGTGYFKITIQNQGSTTVNYKVTPSNPLTIVDNSGVKSVLTGVNNDIVGSLANGTYNKFVDNFGAELLKNTIYKQLKAPTTPNTNDVWIKTVDKPEVYKYSGLEWEEYNKVYIGSFTITSGAVSNIKNTELYDNGFNVTTYNPQIIETYKNGTSWYRVYSDGWCEQGGFSASATQIMFIKPFIFSNNNYGEISIKVTPDGGTNAQSATTCSVYNVSSTSFYFTTANNTYNCFWQASGYIN